MLRNQSFLSSINNLKIIAKLTIEADGKAYPGDTFLQQRQNHRIKLIIDTIESEVLADRIAAVHSFFNNDGQWKPLISTHIAEYLGAPQKQKSKEQAS
jgi:hypothetical protein